MIFQGGQNLDTTGIVAVVTAIITSFTAIYSIVRQSKLKQRISETQLVFEALQKMNEINEKRITSLENRLDAKDLMLSQKDDHILDCERRVSKLEGKVEIFTKLQPLLHNNES